MSGQNYRDLIAWQRAMELVEHVYRVTQKWPREELYGLTNQVRRAAVSIPANVAEGQGRSSQREFLHHLSIALGSLYEAQTHLLISQRLGYSSEADIELVMSCTAEVARLLQGLMRSFRQPTTIPTAPTNY